MEEFLETVKEDPRESLSIKKVESDKKRRFDKSMEKRKAKVEHDKPENACRVALNMVNDDADKAGGIID